MGRTQIILRALKLPLLDMTSYFSRNLISYFIQTRTLDKISHSITELLNYFEFVLLLNTYYELQKYFGHVSNLR